MFNFNFQKNNTNILIKYILFSGIGLCLDIIFFYIFATQLGFNYLLINFLAFIFSSLINYLLCIKFVFLDGSKYNYKLQVILIYAIGFICMLINQITLYIMIDVFKLDILISKYITIIISFSINYTFRRYILFK